MGKIRIRPYLIKRADRTRLNPLRDGFLRKPYQYTSAEPKDDTQARLHEVDWSNTRIWG